MSNQEITKPPQVGGSELNDMLGTDILERSAKALFESQSRPTLKSAGYAPGWDAQPRTVKLDYIHTARTVIKAAIGA